MHIRNSVRRPILLAIVLVTVGVSAAAEVPGAGPFKGWGSLHPKAPAETSQFAFMVGEWNCTTKSLMPDGKTFTEGKATWIGYFILGGWAIQDDWISFGPNGQAVHGTNVRSFNPRTREWDNRWLAAGSQQWKYYAATKVGETMVMIGGEGKDPRGPYIDRNVFYDISADRWRWRKDRSWDGGTTWFEGVSFIEARRAGTAATSTSSDGKDSNAAVREGI